MTLLTAPLTTDQYTFLRGDHRCLWMVAANPNPVMFKARVNQEVFEGDFAQVTFDDVTVGSYSGVKEGWTVFASHTDNIHAYHFRGRVRKVPTSSILYLNQNSGSFADDDYLWVVKDTALHEVLPWKEGNTLYVDWDKPYNQLGPMRANLPSYKVGRLTPGGTVDFDFAPGTYSPTSGRTISSHLWDGDGGTFAVGTETDEDVTIQFDAPGWYEVRHTAIDSAGLSSYFAVRCIVYPADYSSVVAKPLLCESLTNDPSTGWSAQIRTSTDDALVDVLDQTEIVVISEDWFHEVRGSLVTNVKFGGRLHSDDTGVDLSIRSHVVQVSSQTTVNVEGIGAQLSRLILASVTMRRKATPSVLGEIKDLTLWRGMVFLAQLTTLTTIHSLDFDDKSNDYAYPLFTAQDRSAESALSDVAFTINGYFNWNPAGQLFIARHMHYLNATDKAALITIADFDHRDYSGLSVRRDPVPRLGRVIAYGGSFNTSSGNTIALRAKAPAVVWGTGEGRTQLNRQVLKADLSLDDAKYEVAVRAGAEFAAKNLVYSLDVKHPSGYDNVLSSSCYQRYTWTITAQSNRRGFSCTTAKFWWLQRVQIRYTPVVGTQGGYTETAATYIEDITAINAQVMAEIAPEDRPAWVPSQPQSFSTPFLGLPSLVYPTGVAIDPDDEQPYTPRDAQETVPPKKSTDPEKPTPTPAQDPKSRAGSVVAVANSGGLWICEDFNLKAAPTWKNITPGTSLTDFRFDHASGGGWAITNDGTNSVVWRADNILSPNWRGTAIDGVYTQLRPTPLPNGLYIYTAQAAVWEHTFFLSDDGGFVPNPDFPYGVYSDSWNHTDGFMGSYYRRSIDIVLTGFPSATFTDLFLNCDLAKGAIYADGTASAARIGGTTIWVMTDAEVSTGTNQTLAWSGSQAGTSLRVALNACVNSVASFSGSVKFNYLTVRGIGVNPFGSGYANVSGIRASSDNGATFGAEGVMGDSAGTQVGFAVGGAAVYVAAPGIVRESGMSGVNDLVGSDTSGTYARALWDAASGLLMASAAASGGETLWRVSGGAKIAITPNDGANDGLVVSPFALATSPAEDLILMLADFGGTVKLARSTNAGSAWTVSGTGIDSGAKAVRAKNAEQVYIANDADVLYSEDSGATLVSKPAPGSSLILIEVR